MMNNKVIDIRNTINIINYNKVLTVNLVYTLFFLYKV